MKVQEVMTTNAKVCTLTDNLSAAAGLMWENDCGALPVVTEGEKVFGLSQSFRCRYSGGTRRDGRAAGLPSRQK